MKYKFSFDISVFSFIMALLVALTMLVLLTMLIVKTYCDKYQQPQKQQILKYKIKEDYEKSNRNYYYS